MKQYPQEGEVFELEFDGDAPENTPLGIVRSFGHNPENCTYKGTVIAGKQMKKFMLVRIGDQPNLVTAKSVLEAKYGPTPKGQWMKAFKDAYPDPDDNGPIAIADSSWVVPLRLAGFPSLSSLGQPFFAWSGPVLDVRWRWLVAVSDK